MQNQPVPVPQPAPANGSEGQKNAHEDSPAIKNYSSACSKYHTQRMLALQREGGPGDLRELQVQLESLMMTVDVFMEYMCQNHAVSRRAVFDLLAFRINHAAEQLKSQLLIASTTPRHR